ncbi:MAG: pyridoxamine 5'-phosphate oxidase family protein [Pseudomonadota bacterium]
MATKKHRHGDPVALLNHLIKDIRVAMLVTHVGGSGLHGRPMETQDEPFDGRLWFLTSASSPKALEIEEDAEVALVYCDPQAQRYVYVNGRARLRRDAATIERLWRPQQSLWFPRGKGDPDLRALEVSVERALYWIRGNPAGTAAALSQALETGTVPELGDSGTIEFEQRPVPGAEGAAAEHTRPVATAADESAHNVGRAGRRNRSQH